MDMAMSPPSMNGSDMNKTGDMNTMMMMSFYWGKNAIVLFSGWPKESLGMYILALFFVFLLAFAVEIFSNSPSLKQGNSPFVIGLIHTIVYAFKTGLGYLVMLAVMSFNIGIFIAAVAGHSIGFFVVTVRALVLASRVDPKV